MESDELRVINNMVATVDKVKVSLYVLFSEILDIMLDHESNGKSGSIAAAMVNEIYCCHTKDTKSVLGENSEIVDYCFRKFAEGYSNFSQIITTSVQYYSTSLAILSGKAEEEIAKSGKRIQILKERGLFSKDKTQDYTNFLTQVDVLYQTFVGEK